MTRWHNYFVTPVCISFALVTLFGVSGVTIIMSSFLIIIGLLFYICSKEPSISSYSALFCFIVLGLHQSVYMIGVGGTKFYVFGATCLFLFSCWVIFGAIKSSADLYMRSGEKDIKYDRLYLVVKRPKSMSDYFSSLLGSPVSSVSFCMNKKWIRFKEKDDCAVLCDIEKRDGFTFIDISLAADFDFDKFKSIEGKQWSWRKNCVKAWEPFLSGSYLEPRPWEWFPSVYVHRMLNEKDSLINNGSDY